MTHQDVGQTAAAGLTAEIAFQYAGYLINPWHGNRRAIRQYDHRFWVGCSDGADERRVLLWQRKMFPVKAFGFKNAG